jgi:cation:H+ antiporter
MSTLTDVAIIAVATLGIWFGATWLEGASDRLSAYYGLPAVIQGSLVAAIGSSFPELASVVFASLAGSFDLGVGAIVGSAIFNILVIPGIAGIASEETVVTNRAVVYKEAQFYMLSVSALIIIFSLAVIYYPLDLTGPELDGRLTRPLAVLPLLLYCLYLFIQWQDVSDHESDHVEMNVLKQWGLLAAGLLVILVTVEQLVHAVDSLGDTIGTPKFLWGITVLAAATSLPDTIVSVQAAREGKGITSLGNVLGSNTFDLLVAIPLGVLIVGSVPINFAIAVPMMGFLTLATILLFTVLRTGLELTDLESYLLIVAYLLFVSWMVLETAGVTSYVPGT